MQKWSNSGVDLFQTLESLLNSENVHGIKPVGPADPFGPYGKVCAVLHKNNTKLNRLYAYLLWRRHRSSCPLKPPDYTGIIGEKI